MIRIQSLPIETDFIMNMGTAGPSGSSHETDSIAAFYPLARLDQKLAEMAINRDIPGLGMTQFDGISAGWI